jgi:DNA-binding transcriptional regulator YhcF (GntR family)
MLTEQQKKKLVKEAREFGLSNSEILRRIIDKYFEEKEKSNE